MELIAKGAEAEIFKINETTLKKIRLEKTYRIPELDNKLRKSRNRREFKLLTKLCESKVNIPKPIRIEEKEDISFTFEYIDGIVLKKTLNEKLLDKAFEQIIELHKFGVVHGDLTTLNMIEKNGKIYLIDFGLAEVNQKSENRAVDLNLFFKCLQNEHPDFFHKKNDLLKKYEKEMENSEIILKSLEKIEHRGRNKAKKKD